MSYALAAVALLVGIVSMLNGLVPMFGYRRPLGWHPAVWLLLGAAGMVVAVALVA